MKRFFLLFIAALLVVAGTIVYITNQKPSSPVKIPPEVIPVSTITTVSSPQKFTTTPTVTFTYAGAPTTLPESLPTYRSTYPTDLPTQAAALAKRLGISAAVTKPVAYVYDWIDPTQLLSYDDRTKSVSFSLSTPMTPQDIIAALTELHFLSNDFSLAEEGRQTVLEGEGMVTESSPLTAISYQASIKNQPFPFFFSGMTRWAGEMRVDKNGSVVSFSLYVTPQLYKEPERQMLSLNQILTALNDQKGYLAGVDSETTAYIGDIVPSFSSMDISTITPAYLFIPEESRFVPIYVVEGTSRGTMVRRVRYFLRATS